MSSDDALRAARRKAEGLDPAAAAARVGATWDVSGRVLTLPFFGSAVAMTYPGYEVTLNGKPMPPHIAALIVYHLALSDGSAPVGPWISFADLPGASFYVTAFRGYTGAEIARRYAGRTPELSAAVAGLGGVSMANLAESAWHVPALPRVPLALLWWDADEEFDARAEILFDATASRHLSTDGCAVLGSWLTSLLLRGTDH